MVGWHHRLDRHEFEQTLGDSEGQGSLACCSPWGHGELDTTEQLNNHHTQRLSRSKLIIVPLRKHSDRTSNSTRSQTLQFEAEYAPPVTPHHGRYKGQSPQEDWEGVWWGGVGRLAGGPSALPSLSHTLSLLKFFGFAMWRTGNAITFT